MTELEEKEATISYLERALKQAQENLRDRFAMAALTGWIANPDTRGMFNKAAEESYLYADAMMEARK